MLTGPETTLICAWSPGGAAMGSGADPGRRAAPGASEARRVRFLDLLGVPFERGGDDPATGLDCWGQAAEINRRLGKRLPEPGRSAGGLQVVGTRAEDATMLGDLVCSDLEGTGEPSHVSVLVDLDRRLALSCSENGGPFAVPVGMLGKVVRILRAKP